MSTKGPQDTIPPHDEHAEAGIVAGMLADSVAARVAIESGLHQTDFYVPKYRTAFGLLAALWNESGTIDAHAVLSEAPKHNLDGGALLDLAARGNQAPAIERHVRIVKAKRKERQVRAITVKLQRTLDEGHLTEQVRQELRHELDQLAPEESRGPSTIGEWLDSPELNTPIERIPTGFHELDEQLHGGFVPGGVYIVAADTSGGKSTFSLNVARRAALSGIRTWLNTLEDPPAQAVRKILAATSHVSLLRLEKLEFDQRSADAILGARQVLRDLPLDIDEVGDLDALCLALEAQARKGVRLAVVDQRSWIRAEGVSEYERATVTIRRLKQTAKATGIVILLCWQLNRAGATRKDGGPTLHDLRDSGAAEQDSDSVILLPRIEGTSVGCPLTLYLNIAKHRHGPHDRELKITWWPECCRMEGWTPADVTGVLA